MTLRLKTVDSSNIVLILSLNFTPLLLHLSLSGRSELSVVAKVIFYKLFLKIFSVLTGKADGFIDLKVYKKRQRREKQIFQAAVCFLQGTAYAVKKWYPERDSTRSEATMSLRDADRRSSNARQPDNSEQCRFQQPLKTIQGKKKRQRREKANFPSGCLLFARHCLRS